MVLIPDVLRSVDSAFPIFSYGERHIDEFLERYTFDRDGISQQWEMFERLSKNVRQFLRDSYPALGELNYLICSDLQMHQLREKIERNEREYECYRSIMARYTEGF